MNNLNPLYQEQMAQRADEELRRQTNPIDFYATDRLHSRHTWTAHQLTHFAAWMIATGEQLRQRYDHDAIHSGHPQALAH